MTKGELKVAKVKGEANAAEGLTKHGDRHKMEAHVNACGVVRKSGRHELRPCLGGALAELALGE